MKIKTIKSSELESVLSEAPLPANYLALECCLNCKKRKWDTTTMKLNCLGSTEECWDAAAKLLMKRKDAEDEGRNQR